jgi:hypothetical protein
MTPGADRVGVMVVRIWIEGSSGSVRARMTQTLDVTSRDHPSQVAVSPEQILDAVGDWIQAFMSQAC